MPIEFTPAERMENALLVFILNDRIHNWLLANDPKVLEQAINAVEMHDPGVIAKCRIAATLHNAVIAAAATSADPAQAQAIDYWRDRERTEPTGPVADWAGCCRASRRIWELINANVSGRQAGRPQAVPYRNHR